MLGRKGVSFHADNKPTIVETMGCKATGLFSFESLVCLFASQSPLISWRAAVSSRGTLTAVVGGPSVIPLVVRLVRLSKVAAVLLRTALGRTSCVDGLSLRAVSISCLNIMSPQPHDASNRQCKCSFASVAFVAAVSYCRPSARYETPLIKRGVH